MKRLIVKIGTDNLINASGSLDPLKAADISRQVATLMSQGIEVILVSSGAIQAGKDRMNQMGKNVMLQKKEWAGVGARHLLNLWGNAFETHGLEVAQVWLTYSNWIHPEEYQSIKTSFASFFDSDTVALVNENDVVSQREIEYMEKGIGENDRLARMVAEMVEADAVLFLTDIGGVYDKDPRTDSSAKRYRSVGPEILNGITGSETASPHGTGSIRAKLQEAFICFEKGMKVAIAGLEPDAILRFVSGDLVGTAVGEVTAF